ncbi:unnamed protein product, partial [Brenthis ino]
MFKLFLRLSLGLLVINLAIHPCDGFRYRGYNTKHGRGYKDNTKSNSAATPPALPNQGPARRGLGLSAWGIITVIVSFILAIAGMYYFSICYPIICQKNKKYDMIGLTSVA